MEKGAHALFRAPKQAPEIAVPQAVSRNPLPAFSTRSLVSRVNLFVIGVNKAGTSWLYYLLSQHPDVFMSEVKELYFFGSDREGPASLEAYHEHFPFDQPYRYFGEATVTYYQDADVADEIRAYNPEARVLAIVRDPIQRLLSQYRFHKQLGIVGETESLAEALAGRPPGLYRDSHYEQTLPAFTERFGNDQFRIVSLEEGKDAPERLWDDLCSFLDLPPAPFPDGNTTPENPTGSPAFRQVYRALVQPIKTHWPGAYQWMLQNPVARQAKLALLRLLGTAEPDALSPEMERHLREEFAPTYDYLHSLGFDVYDPPPHGG